MVIKNFETVIMENHFAFGTYYSRVFLANFTSPLFLCWNLHYLVISNIVKDMVVWNSACSSFTYTITIIFQKNYIHKLSSKWQSKWFGSSSVWLIWWRIQAFWTDTSSIHAKRFYHHFLILISMWYLAMFWSISLTKPTPWLQQWNWFGWEIWMNFWSILLQQQTNLVDCDGRQLEAMYTVQLLFHPVTVIPQTPQLVELFLSKRPLGFFPNLYRP